MAWVASAVTLAKMLIGRIVFLVGMLFIALQIAQAQLTPHCLGPRHRNAFECFSVRRRCQWPLLNRIQKNAPPQGHSLSICLILDTSLFYLDSRQMDRVELSLLLCSTAAPLAGSTFHSWRPLYLTRAFLLLTDHLTSLCELRSAS